eukprot:CAMPEP_0116876188 /NCGR_PEP_ID=MMETSP0463-20121206/8191_1 /TAXON_ID=181622 /ORGANISM="Strombidinopsis sp, Strain SopsisLIS2011" /LENGTH=123 /DNA_ID=CAMNT_0004522665 /DNA_START=8 /DNA_END=379 /DNA_ORIENTATION=+
MEIKETAFFKNQSQENGIVGEDYYVNQKHELEAKEAKSRLHAEIDDGIVRNLTQRRLQGLEIFALQNCYQNPKYNFLQASKCEQYFVENDAKLHLLKNFFPDHFVRHDRDHERCSSGPEFESL